MLFRVVPKRSVSYFEKFGCPSAHSITLLKGGQQVTPFSVGDFLLAIDPFGRKRWLICNPSPGTGCRRVGRDAVGKNTQGYFRPGLERNGSLQGVFQLTNVARPIVGFQAANRFRREPLDGLLHRLSKPLEKVPRQKGYILSTFPQGR